MEREKVDGGGARPFFILFHPTSALTTPDFELISIIIIIIIVVIHTSRMTHMISDFARSKSSLASKTLGKNSSKISLQILMSTGYMLHDLLDLLINERSVRILELLFHHIVVLTAFTTTLTSHQFLGVVVCGLLMEVNSIFLHSRSLLNLYGWPKASPLYRLVSLTNMMTLFVFRMAVSVWLIVWQVSCWDDMEWYFVIVTGVVILSLGITNSVLAYRVLAADGYLGESRARLAPPPAVPVRESKDGGNLVLVGVDIEE